MARRLLVFGKRPVSHAGSDPLLPSRTDQRIMPSWISQDLLYSCMCGKPDASGSWAALCQSETEHTASVPSLFFRSSKP